MRTAFFQTLMEAATRDERVFLVTGDLGFGVVEPFAAAFPDRFLNAGVAEQNMTGIAAGLALSGKVVFTYSIANFPTLRCLEQIRNDVCYHEANVTIVSVGGGFAYGSLGPSHHATEDLAIMRALPGMTVLAPGDPKEAAGATRAAVAHAGPCYLRLGRAGERTIHRGPLDFQIGRAIQVREGRAVTLIATGGMLETAVDVAGRLALQGVESRVLSMHTLRPLDNEAVLAAAEETGGIVTLEEHSVIGGLGSAVAEVLAAITASAFAAHAGTQEYLRFLYGLSPEAIQEKVSTLLAGATAVRTRTRG